ncbi:MAG: ester cyclase [Chloroflexota bacterium]
MPAQENKAIIRRLFEKCFNEEKSAVADELIAPNFVNHVAPPGHPPGPEGVKRNGARLRAAFPDIHVTIVDMMAEGDKVVVRFASCGTHKGTFLGVPPTGKRVKWAGIDTFTIAEGKLVEAWGYVGELDLLRQFGVVLPPGQTES